MVSLRLVEEVAGKIEETTGRFGQPKEILEALKSRSFSPDILPSAITGLQRAHSNESAIDQIESIGKYLEKSGSAEDQKNLVKIGRLPNSTDLNSSENATILDNVNRLVSHKTNSPAEEKAKQEVISNLLEHLANPETIHQDSTATCTMTNLQRQLASEQPAEYARLVTDLFTTGQAQLADGSTTIERNANYLNRRDANTSNLHPPRDLTEILVQDALMQQGAKEVNGSYNAETDTTTRRLPDGQVVQEKGLHDRSFMEVYTKVLNQGFDLKSVDDYSSPSALTSEILQQANNGSDVPVRLHLGASAGDHERHKVTVTGSFEKNGVEYVTLYNSWGVSDGKLNAYSQKYPNNFGNSWHAALADPNDPSSGKVEIMTRADFEKRVNAAMLTNGKTAAESDYSNIGMPGGYEDLHNNYPFRDGVFEIQSSVKSFVEDVSQLPEKALNGLKDAGNAVAVNLVDLTRQIEAATTNSELSDFAAAFHKQKQMEELERRSKSAPSISELAHQGLHSRGDSAFGDSFWFKLDPNAKPGQN